MEPQPEHASVERWRRPPEAIARVIDAPPTPWIVAGPNVRWLLLVEHPALPSLEDLARPMLRLAGLRIDPSADARHQTSFGTALRLRDREGVLEREVELPAGRRITAVRWSHDGVHFACTLVGGAGTELAIGDVRDARLEVAVERLHAVFGEGFEFAPDGRRMVVSRVPPDRGAAPAPPDVPEGPSVQETAGTVTPLRTYADLLRDARDEALFEHHATCELAELDLATRETRPLGIRGIVLAWDTAPGGGHVLVTRARRPFSYTHDVYGFPQTIEAFDREGSCVARVAEVPAAENVPVEGVREGPRQVVWSPHEPATLAWVEALDGGDPNRRVPHRDRWLEREVPFAAPAREIARLEHRAGGISWMRDPSLVVLRDYERERRWTRTVVRSRVDPQAPALVLDDRSIRDRYADPGALLTAPDGRGRRLVREEDGCVFRAGEGAAEAGARPFLDRQRLGGDEHERLWRCGEGEYESFLAMVEEHGRAAGFVTRHESPSAPPNVRLRRFGEPGFVEVTRFADTTPELRAIERRLVTYERDDGVALSGHLYLPPGWGGEPLPLVLWAYPQDYVDVGTAGQVRGSPHRFTRIQGASHLVFALAGYAVLDDASMPIVGEPATMNDRFVEQAVASARAAVEHLAATGVADPARCGVGGHSYGAFLAATLLAHSDLFRAGIARSGAYNRTLTPFGFQSERRTLWEARESYWKLSPFLYADRIRAPLLLVHGAEDSNPGTAPIQSERMFRALKATGGTARHVVLPHEGHAYRARESVHHVVAEMLDWFGRYVKGEANAGR